MPFITEEYCKKLLADTVQVSGLPTEQDPDTCTELFAKIVRLVQVRDRSVKELRNRLLKNDADPTDVESALARALDCGLLDDQRFAETLIISRKNAGRGRAGIERELEENDIDSSQISGWPEEYFPSEEEEVLRACALLERRPPTAKNKREAAYRKLVSKGYASSLASRAARIWFESQDS
ncbi:MAG: regulatory protein RecX [Raoultibacter sp.]|jgi:regulatory protein